VTADGRSAEIVRDYYASLLDETGDAEFEVAGDVGVSHIALTSDGGEPLAQPVRGEPFTIQARVVAQRDVGDVDLAMHVVSSEGTLIFTEHWSDQPGLPPLIDGPGEYLVRLRVPPLLRAGEYLLGLWLGSPTANYFDDDRALGFTVVPQVDDRQEWITRPRTVQPETVWTRVREGDMERRRAALRVP
jgi:hypothetical protein